MAVNNFTAITIRSPIRIHRVPKTRIQYYYVNLSSVHIDLIDGLHKFIFEYGQINIFIADAEKTNQV